MKPWRWKILVLAGVALIGAALWKVAPDYLDRLAARWSYEDLRGTYVKISGQENDKKNEEWWVTDVRIRFDELTNQYPDVAGWIRSDNPEVTGMDYPVLYSGDNEKYLRRDPYGNDHIAGSIFLEGLNSSDFRDYYNIIYGHNMNDGSMFGRLKKYKDQDFWEANQYFTIYTAGTVYRYRIFACQEAQSKGDVFKIGYEPGEQYQKLVDSMTKNSFIISGIRPESSERILTLSTCTGDGYGRRFTVHAVCVDVRK